MERLAVTADEAAALLGVHTTTIYRAIKRGEIEVVRISGRMVIPAVSLVAMFGEPIEVTV